ncbi:MAG: hypothetical protein IIW10_01500, partial [Spirochaetaceae bacterium]|nr:hypothetical protein [Spirochaetaceae bacterium]
IMKKSLKVPVIVILVAVALASCSGVNQKSLYDIKIDEYIDGGTVRLVANTFDAGSMVKLKVYPNENMEIQNLYYTVQGSDKSVPIDINSMTFQKPNASIVIKADFVSIEKPELLPEALPEEQPDNQ